MSAIRSILTVLDPATTSDLTTLDTLKDELGIQTNDSDATLRRMIRGASSAIADYTNRTWGKERIQEIFPEEAWSLRSWNDPAEFGIRLRRTPVVEVESVTDWYGTALTTDDYEVDLSTGTFYRLWRGEVGVWRCAPQTIVYWAGYELLGTLPDSIEQACIELCKLRWRGRSRDPMVRSIDIPGVQRVDYWVGAVGDNGAIPPQVAGLLERYVVPNV